MSDMLDLAASVAREAGSMLRRRYREPRTGVGSKTTATDMVTDADRASEELIVARFGAARPDDEVVSEEGSRAPGTSGYRWIVDPLDGTTNFLFGVPQWGVSIACEDAHGTVVGVVFDPIRDEMFAAERGGGATLNGAPVRVSAATDLSRALIGTGFSYRPEERAVAGAALGHILPEVRDIRRPGSCALDLAWTACGRYDGYYEAPTMPWDYLAGALLVREAGGIVGSLEPIGPSGGGVVAAGPGIFEPLRALVTESLARARRG